MGGLASFKDLIVWQKSHQLVLKIYSTTSNFPKEEIYALSNQMRRATVSIPANIAEGFRKKTLANKLNYLSHSEGSLEEVKYYLILAKDLTYITTDEYEELTNQCEEISKLIGGYTNTIKKYHKNKTH